MMSVRRHSFSGVDGIFYAACGRLHPYLFCFSNDPTYVVTLLYAQYSAFCRVYVWLFCGIWCHLCVGLSDDSPDLQSYRTGVKGKSFSIACT